MRKPVLVEGPYDTIEALAEAGNISPERTRELVEMARESIANQARRTARSKARKAAAKRGPTKAAKR
jgi:hypothetical protein